MEVKHRDSLKFHNKHRYSGRKFFNGILSFVWSVLVFVGLTILAVVIFYYCRPWLTMLWETISGRA